MNEVSIIINGVRYDAVEMTPEGNHMVANCNLCDLQHECKTAPVGLEIPCGYILGLSRCFKKSDKKFEQKASDWISVEDRLPEFDEYVFIAIEMKYDFETEIKTEIDIGWINEDGDFSMINDWYEGQQHFKITHWQPIVLPKKEMNEIPTEKLLPQGLQDMLSAHRKYTAQANDINNEIIDREMKTLHLPLKAKWYEMIESGVKNEEYREIKPYWERRLIDYKELKRDYNWIVFRKVVLGKWTNPCEHYPKDYTHVKFSYGYTKRTMTFEIESITIGKGNPEWGAPTEDVFIIKLGKRV